MILVGLKIGEIDIGIGWMLDFELMIGFNYELLFFELLKLVVCFNYLLFQENVMLSWVLEWLVVVLLEGIVLCQYLDVLVQSQGCKIFLGCIEMLFVLLFC